jgi:type III secretory pathway component EscS
MLPVSLDCLFVVVLCTQCCQCLWMVCLSSSYVLNVASVSGLFVCRDNKQTTQRHWQHWVHKTTTANNPVTLATLGTQDDVLCTQCCQCLWIVCLSSSCVLNVASVSGLFVCRRLVYPMLSVSLDGLFVVVLDDDKQTIQRHWQH